MRPPRPPRPRPRPSYLPIAIKSPTRSASAKRTRQPPALRSPGNTRGMGPQLRAQTGSLERASFLSPRLFSKHRWTGMLAPIRTIASGPLPRAFFPTSPSPPSLLTLHPPHPPRSPSPGCVICIFTFKFPLPSLSPVAALPACCRGSLYLCPPPCLLPPFSYSLLVPGDPISFSVSPTLSLVSCLRLAPRLRQDTGASPLATSELVVSLFASPPF